LISAAGNERIQSGTAPRTTAALNALWRITRLNASSFGNGVSTNPSALAVLGAHTHSAGMFVVSETEAAAIRAVYEQRGEFSAAVELRRLFPAITDTAQARECVRTIAGWKPLPERPLRPKRFPRR
jgi:hypothetical protein